MKDGYLTGVTERTHIEKRGNDAAFTEDGKTWTPLSGDTVVSMNLWGFSPMILSEIERRFPDFLRENLPKNPERCEFYLPSVANAQIQEKTATIRVLHTTETWYGARGKTRARTSGQSSSFASRKKRCTVVKG